MAATTQSFANIIITKPLCCSTPRVHGFFTSQHPVSTSFASVSFKFFPQKLQNIQLKGIQLRKLRPTNASAAETPSSENAEKWLLEPVGDGDSRHIGFKVPMPDAFEIASSVVTVGRLPEKADMVIPVATVSGLHARIEKKEGNLMVTDLESTNGTFIDDKRLRPGVVAILSPGSCITFVLCGLGHGNQNLTHVQESNLVNPKK
ncbi:PREDICTED: uncharacterized protein LOC104587718 isoform X2 [Nelumbo nucifera]|uniref:Uncharacterized protein LOC104587718 isoform X2 n=1 Tax=Nelumbo nucifera TaxID=4432 RepID=A0A1U7YTR2_NELNU|nr:PREDICTED: uncharacterized protein LOC104587718 isoform X2 [Nelumbo nucifera]